MTEEQQNEINEMLDRMSKLRKGESVKCKYCNKGQLEPIGDCRTTHCFVCGNCGTKLNID